MGIDLGAVGAIAGLNNQKFYNQLALQRDAQGSPLQMAQAANFNADANFSGVRAGLLPKTTAADIAKTQADTNLTNVNAAWAPRLSAASIANTYSEAGEHRAQGGLLGIQGRGELQDQTTLSKAAGGDPNALRLLYYTRNGLFPSNGPAAVPSSTPSSAPLTSDPYSEWYRNQPGLGYGMSGSSGPVSTPAPGYGLGTTPAGLR